MWQRTQKCTNKTVEIIFKTQANVTWHQKEQQGNQGGHTLSLVPKWAWPAHTRYQACNQHASLGCHITPHHSGIHNSTPLMCHMAHYVKTWSIKLKVHNILHCRQRKTKPLPQLSCTYMKTDRQTDHNTLHNTMGEFKMTKRWHYLEACWRLDDVMLYYGNYHLLVISAVSNVSYQH